MTGAVFNPYSGLTNVKIRDLPRRRNPLSLRIRDREQKMQDFNTKRVFETLRKGCRDFEIGRKGLRVPRFWRYHLDAKEILSSFPGKNATS